MLTRGTGVILACFIFVENTQKMLKIALGMGAGYLVPRTARPLCQEGERPNDTDYTKYTVRIYILEKCKNKKRV